MNKLAIEAILNGQKTIETRFSQFRIVPFGQVAVGDIVYLKPPGEEIIGQFRVKKVISYEGLIPEEIDKIFTEFGDKIQDQVVPSYKDSKKNSQYGTLIFITQSERLITSPLKIKKKDQRGWVVLKQG